MFDDIRIDPDLIPDEKDRLLKESFELFRRASYLHDSAHFLTISTTPAQNTNLRRAFLLSILELEKERNKLVEDAIDRYMRYKKLALKQKQKGDE